MLMHVRKASVNSMRIGKTTGSSGPTSVDIGSGQWHAAVVASSSGGTATSEYTDDSYEMKTRAARTVRIVDIADAGRKKGKAKDSAAVRFTSLGTYSDGRGPDSPGKHQSSTLRLSL